MRVRRYRYVGPEKIRLASVNQPPGVELVSPQALRDWLAKNEEALHEGSTFVVNLGGQLVLAPRRSEHVACAAGRDVLAAGEVRFSRALAVVDVTNQSTGYCPDVDCWRAVAPALQLAGVEPPSTWTHAFVFRRCTACEGLNVVKDAWFVCALCDAELPREWNFSSAAVLA